MKNKCDKVIAIFCSDLHLSLTPPPLRSQEPDWFAAMQRPLDEIRQLKELHHCSVFCAGDIFDKWNSSPELINWAIQHNPVDYAIPGQHDLPEHDINQIERSAYRTMEKAHAFESLDPTPFTPFADFTISAFPFGSKIRPAGKNKTDYIRIALIHQYNWIPGHVYSDSPKGIAGHIDSSRKEFEGYDIVVSGDNHIPFSDPINHGNTQFVNCGSLMRRKSDDKGTRSIWLLQTFGRVQRHSLDCSKDIYIETDKAKKLEELQKMDLTGLFNELTKLGKSGLDFMEVLRQQMEKAQVCQAVRTILERASEV
jgi:hypothetical protein